MIDIKALDAAAEERAASLGKPHMVDGTQPYHADALTPSEHVAGNVPVAVEPVETELLPESEPVSPDPTPVSGETERCWPI